MAHDLVEHRLLTGMGMLVGERRGMGGDQEVDLVDTHLAEEPQGLASSGIDECCDSAPVGLK